jgi:acyl-CoA synthetase (AMP-forming)/AMP-acid ligase II
MMNLRMAGLSLTLPGWLGARYKIPCYVRFMTSFPMTVTGKVAKYLLREQVAHELSAHEKEAT